MHALLICAALGLLAGDERVKPGPWSPADDPPPGWVVVRTDHYEVQSQAGTEKAKALAAHLEAMLELYREMLPFRKNMPTFVLKLFESGDAYHSYGGPAGAAAHYDKGNKELVAYDTGIVLGVRDVPAQIALVPMTDGILSAAERQRVAELCEAFTDSYVYDTARVLSHEGWHQYFHFYTVSWVAMPSWLDEGLGDYFFTAERAAPDAPSSGSGRKKPSASDRCMLGALNHGRLRALRRAFEEGTTVSFSEMLGFEQQDYYSNPGVYYAQGWSMVHFLMQNTDPHLRRLIPELIEDFKDSKNFRKASDEAFEDFELEQIDRDWIAWVLSTEPVDPLLDLAREFGDRVGPEDLVTDDRWRNRYAWLREKLGLGAPAEVKGPSETSDVGPEKDADKGR